MKITVPLSIWLVCCVLLSTGFCQTEDKSGVYQARSKEPTAHETLILEYINRCRANPTQEAAIIIEAGRVPKNVDAAMFQREMEQASPAPPLVFNLNLVKAARWHSWYQIKHGQTHFEEPGASGFTGVKPNDRTRKAGFQERHVSENVFSKGRNPWYSHCGFIVDWGAGPGGMQPERGHRRSILNPRFRSIGVAALVYGKGRNQNIAVTHNFGGGTQRMAGGVVYKDLNDNRFYDLKEGVGGVQMTVGDASVESWESGAYSIPISTEEQKIKVTVEETTYVGLLPAGEENVKFDVIHSEVARYARSAKLLANVKKIPDDEQNADRRFAALTDLCLITEDGLIEESIFDEITDLTGPVREELDNAFESVRQAMSGDLDEAEELISELLKKYRRSTVKGWFTEAKNCLSIVKAYRQMKALADSGRQLKASEIQRKIKSQQKVSSRLKVPEWQAFGLEVGQQMLQLGE